MGLRFTIIDQLGNSTVIDEPVGWDATSLHYIRHKEWHGFIDTVDDTMGSLQFYGNGHRILSSAFATYGVEAQCGFLVEFQCSDDDSWDTIYQGQFSFYRYKEVEGMNGCHAECSIESVTNVMTLKNRYSQKVDLDSLYPFETPANPQAAALNQIQAVSTTLSAPPDPAYTPLNNGDIYLIPTPHGTWGGAAGQLAIWTDGSWSYTTPASGQVVIDMSTRLAYIYSSGSSTWSLYTDTLTSYSPALGGFLMLPPKILNIGTSANVDSAGSTYYFDNGSQTSHCFTLLYDASSTQDIQNFSAISDNWSGVNWYSTGNNTNIGNKAAPILNYQPIQNYLGTAITISFDVNFTLASAVTNGTDPVSGDTIYVVSPGSNPNPPYTIPLVDLTFIKMILCKGPGIYQDAMQHGTIGSVINIPVTVTGTTGSGTGFSTATAVYSFPPTTVPISPGDNIYLVFQFEFHQRYTTLTQICCLTATTGSLTLSMDTGFNQTPSPAYLINESLSRVSEAITNDEIRVYSDFFGRTDSHPYNTVVNHYATGLGSGGDGHGSLLALTKGMLIRGHNMTDGTQPPMTVSLKELFEDLNAIYNIGMSIEPDLARGSGKNWLRIEPMQHFYPDTVILTCDNINEITTEIIAENYVGMFKTGYTKWQGEQAGGLGDFMTKREYRTSLASIRNVLEKYCNFIASSYAIETTRRQSGDNTQDWRFDNDIFLLCLEPPLTTPLTVTVATGVTATMGAGTSAGTVSSITFTYGGLNYTVPPLVSIAPPTSGIQARAQATVDPTSGAITGITVTNPGSGYTGTPSVSLTTAPAISMDVEQSAVSTSTNITNPATIYNYRISPARNAMRWLRSIFPSYADWLNGILYYVSGEANILAKGQYNDTSGIAQVIEGHPIAENQNLSYSDFASPSDYYPLFTNRLVKFTYPLSYTAWKTITANPYGLIAYTVNGGATQHGWIEELKYSPFEGTAEFTLKKKI